MASPTCSGPARVERDGVLVGDVFFQGFPHPAGGKGERVALFAIPRNAPEAPLIRVVARDRAGNETALGWSTRLKERSFDQVPIRLSTGFLETKVPELAELLRIDASDRIRAFQQINQETRARNEDQIRAIVAESGAEPLFDGAFLQMRNSAVTSRFAEHRSYLVEGEKVSEAIHYGYDLASTANAPIEASNRGRVLFAGDLGIYGSCVILDHGLGLTSLYAHLSRIDVQVGDVIERGATLGTSGATGLAGGDHLHFAILVGGTYVDPKEWWDAKWVSERVEPWLGER
jgi:murein DD-endopeptidase MepM/ murein hydrolase activator NlpD